MRKGTADVRDCLLNVDSGTTNIEGRFLFALTRIRIHRVQFCFGHHIETATKPDCAMPCQNNTTLLTLFQDTPNGTRQPPIQTSTVYGEGRQQQPIRFIVVATGTFFFLSKTRLL